MLTVFGEKNSPKRPKMTLKRPNYKAIWLYCQHIAYYDDKAISSVSNYLDGKLNGEFKFFYKNGIIAEIGEYKSGLRTGRWKSFYPNDSLYTTGTYSDDKFNGKWEVYYPNGKFKQIGNYPKITR